MASVRKLCVGAIKNDALLVFANLTDPVSVGGRDGWGKAGTHRSSSRLFLEQSFSGLLWLYVWCFYFLVLRHHLTRTRAARSHQRPTSACCQELCFCWLCELLPTATEIINVRLLMFLSTCRWKQEVGPTNHRRIQRPVLKSDRRVKATVDHRPEGEDTVVGPSYQQFNNQ